MGNNLTGQTIASTYEQLVQISGSILTDGTGSNINNLTVTASLATNAVNSISASYASIATSASYAFNATSASYAANAEGVDDALYTASISNATITFTKGDASTFGITVNNVVNADSASLAANATSASFASTAANATSASYAATATSSSYALTASFAENAGSDFPYTGSAIISGSLGVTGSITVVSGSFSGSVIDNITDVYTTSPKVEHVVTLTQAQYNGITPDVNTFYIISDSTPFDSSIFATTGSNTFVGDQIISGSLTVTGSIIGTATNAISSSYALTASYAENAGGAVDTGSLLVTASISDATITFTKGDASTFNVVVNNVVNANSASLAANATSASFATNASTATSASFASNIASGLNITASSMLVTNNLTVNGTASFAYTKTTTGSAVIIGDAFIILNADTPAAPYAGIMVYDTGSASTASFEWNGIGDYWITVEENGDSAMILTGLSGSKGSEVAPALNKLLKGTGNNTVADSNITDNGTLVTIDSNVSASGFVSASEFVGNLTGTATNATSASYAATATSASYAQVTDTATSSSYATNALSASYADNANSASFASTATSASFASTATSASFASTAATATTASYVLNAVSSSYSAFALSASYSDTANSSSYALNAGSSISASYADNSNSASFAESSSFATTASFALNATPGFPYTGSAGISGSLNVQMTESRVGTLTSGSFTGSFITNLVPSASITGSQVEKIVTLDSATYFSLSASSAVQDDTLYVISDTSGNVIGDTIISGSVRGEVVPLSIASLTASLDCSTGNFFTLTLVSGSSTFVNPSNIASGQTISLKVKQASVASGSIAFPASVKQVSGSLYTATGTANAEDIVTFISFDTASLYLSNVKNLV